MSKTSDCISAHVKKCFGPVSHVLHETGVEKSPHVDILILKADEERPFHFLITSGMSDLSMKIPEDANVPSFVELMLILPPYWQLPETFDVIGGQSNIQWQWPLHLLRFLAHFPHDNDTWLGFGHTIDNPFSMDTKFKYAIILPSCYLPDELQQVVCENTKTIHFFSVVPLYEEEMALKDEKGLIALLNLFNEHHINDLFIPDRINVAD